ncbi:hypothetical protein Godav_024854 [Gossypium davidsonii]|uniref:Uncharacterized protein n=2 Tax=Gossypium TaxID=3633 RepID=A0A7J8TF71_GOSDV|nr:hypothetical protein [Gossypium davidsonii]MBA0670772.1 hypothetical protein [Gossypium klotzschianum]
MGDFEFTKTFTRFITFG